MPRYVPDFDELDKQLGALVRHWADLEIYLGLLFSALIGPPAARHLSLFYAIVNNQARAELMRKALLFSSFTPKQAEETTKIIAKFQALNSKRNKYIHALYLEDEKGVTSGNPAAPEKVGEGRIVHFTEEWVNGSEIANHVKAVSALRDRISRFLKKHRMGRAKQQEPRPEPRPRKALGNGRSAKAARPTKPRRRPQS